MGNTLTKSKVSKSKSKLNKDNYGYLFIAPFFIVFSIFTVYPIFYTLFLSLNSYDGLTTMNFIGLANYKRLITDEFFWKSFFNTWKIWIVNIIPQIGLALLLAVWFTDTRYRLKGVGFFRATFYLPNLMTAASIALLFNVILDWQNGALNQLLMSFGAINEPINWLRDPLYTTLTVSLIQWWLWFGYTLVLIMAGVLGIPATYYEAAVVDGASRSQVFRKITLPLLKPIMLYITVTSLIGGMQIFDVPYILTDGKGAPDKSILTMVIYLYNQGFNFNNFGYAATVAYGIFLVIAFFSFFLFRIYRNKENQ